MKAHWIRAIATRLVLEAAEARGVSAASVLAEADVALPDDPAERIPLTWHLAVWTTVMTMLRDPGFPVDVAERVTYETFDVVGYAVRSAPDLRAGLTIAERYGKIYSQRKP